MTKLPDFLSRIEARVNAATPGKWGVIDTGRMTIIRSDNPRTQADVLFFYPYKERHEAELFSVADARFIATSRTDIPTLIAMLRVACEALEEYSNHFDRAIAIEAINKIEEMVK